jgi:cell division protein ZapA
MGQVTVHVNGRDYEIACADGQESHVVKLASDLDERIGQIGGASRRRDGESLILLMASLIVIDELADARAEIERLTTASPGAEDDPALAASVSSLAERIESIAERLAAP